MPRKRKRKKSRIDWSMGLPTETIHAILAIIFLVAAVFLALSATGNAGIIGTRIYEFLKKLLGIGYFLLPALSLMLSIAFVTSLDARFGAVKTIAAVVFFLSGLGMVELIFSEKGGLVGSMISRPLIALFDVYASIILLGALFLISIIVIFHARFNPDTLLFWRRWGNKEKVYIGDEEYDEVSEEFDDEYEEDEEEEDIPEVTLPREEPIKPIIRKRRTTSYVPPPLSLLDKDRGKPGVGDIKANANIIKRTFQNFGINVEMDEVSIGPSITRYSLKPAEGVRLSKILGLQSNLELALAAHPVRIEAPIPGKSLVGIEVPNTKKSTVGLGTLLSSAAFQDSTHKLIVAIGKGLSGKVMTSNIEKMPHILIAGATGAGKSVTIHDIIVSLIYKRGPDELKFIMVDPKRVELPLYNGIPHLLTPVITDAKKTILALKWLGGEMERRYEILQNSQARDIDSYHKKIASLPKGQDDVDTMPYIVVVIDELADIMSTYPRELEAAIVRLAQMSRAVGIHLILSTQRPSVNVITGLIKANIPARLALQVSSQVDSRTILDMAGAEKLLGAGDILYMSGDMAKPTRLQAGFVSEEEVKKVVKYLKREYADSLPDEVIDFGDMKGDGKSPSASFDDDDEDELYEDARETVIRAGKASTSYLQRKLRIGYARAARLMDILEENGIIGPADGSRPREVLEKMPGEESPDMGHEEKEEEEYHQL